MTREDLLDIFDSDFDVLDDMKPATSGSTEELIEEFNKKHRVNVMVDGVKVCVRPYLKSNPDAGIQVKWGSLFGGMVTYYENIEEALIDVLAYNM